MATIIPEKMFFTLQNVQNLSDCETATDLKPIFWKEKRGETIIEITFFLFSVPSGRNDCATHIPH